MNEAHSIAAANMPFDDVDPDAVDSLLAKGLQAMTFEDREEINEEVRRRYSTLPK